MVRDIIFAIIVAGFLTAGSLEIGCGDVRKGVIAIGFGILNALIFFK